MKFYLMLLVCFSITFIDVFAQVEEEGPTPLGPGRGTAAIYLGPVAGFNRAVHSANLASFADDPLCPFFTNGSSNGFYVGGFYEQILGGVVSKHSLVGRIIFNTMPAVFEKEGDTYPSLVDDGRGGFTTVLSSTRHTLNVTYSMLTVEAMYKFNIAYGLVVTGGPTFDFVLQSNLLQKMEIVEPANVKFKMVPRDQWKEKGIVRYENNDRTIVAWDGAPARPTSRNPDVKSTAFRFSLKFGIQYEIITGTKIDIIPGIFYNLGVTNVNNVESWKVSSIQAGVDIRFTL
ncbi:MAG: hypothetical protein N2517_00340 [Ignavibacteria bacterium]|nr:hypothetical protein [Ignavibacteria bacterium]